MCITLFVIEGGDGDAMEIIANCLKESWHAKTLTSWSHLPKTDEYIIVSGTQGGARGNRCQQHFCYKIRLNTNSSKIFTNILLHVHPKSMLCWYDDVNQSSIQVHSNFKSVNKSSSCIKLECARECFSNVTNSNNRNTQIVTPLSRGF